MYYITCEHTKILSRKVYSQQMKPDDWIKTMVSSSFLDKIFMKICFKQTTVYFLIFIKNFKLNIWLVYINKNLFCNIHTSTYNKTLYRIVVMISKT